MTDPNTDRLVEVRREHAALQYATAMLLDDKRLECDVHRRLSRAGRIAWLDLFNRSGRLLVENLPEDQRAELADTLQDRIARLVSRFGEELDPSDGPQFDDAGLDDGLRRLLAEPGDDDLDLDLGEDTP